MAKSSLLPKHFKKNINLKNIKRATKALKHANSLADLTSDTSLRERRHQQRNTGRPYVPKSTKQTAEQKAASLARVRAKLSKIGNAVPQPMVASQQSRVKRQKVAQFDDDFDF